MHNSKLHARITTLSEDKTLNFLERRGNCSFMVLNVVDFSSTSIFPCHQSTSSTLENINIASWDWIISIHWRNFTTIIHLKEFVQGKSMRKYLFDIKERRILIKCFYWESKNINAFKVKTNVVWIFCRKWAFKRLVCKAIVRSISV